MTVAAILVAAAMAPAVQAQVPGRAYYDPPSSRSPTRAAQPTLVRVAVSGGGIGTTVSVPDGGSAMLGGYDRASESSSEYGAPIGSRVPYADRGLRNRSYGRSTVSGRAIVSVRIIDLREEEYRQTGYRSR
jgi:general secretion pathway protein D